MLPRRPKMPQDAAKSPQDAFRPRFWNDFGRFVGGFREDFGRILGGWWSDCGKILGRICCLRSIFHSPPFVFWKGPGIGSLWFGRAGFRVALARRAPALRAQYKSKMM